MTGGMTIDAVSGHPASSKVLVRVNTNLTISESNGFWLAFACLADDASKIELQPVHAQ
jgi:hypothetical protein